MRADWRAVLHSGMCVVAIACLAMCGLVRAGEKTGKSTEEATDQAAAPEREIPAAEERAQRLTDRMKGELGLTEEQVPRVAEVNLRIAKQVDEIRSASGGSRDERADRMRSAQGQRDTELKEILTKEQWTQYEKMRDAMKAKARDRVKEYRRTGGDGERKDKKPR